jgi:hypothetical protein
LTYHASFVAGPVLLPCLKVLHDLNLDLRVVVLVTVSLVLEALLGDLLVVHGVLGLVDAVALGNRLHGCRFSLLSDVEGDLGDVLDSCLHEFLMERGSGRQHSIDTLHSSKDGNPPRGLDTIARSKDLD